MKYKVKIFLFIFATKRILVVDYRKMYKGKKFLIRFDEHFDNWFPVSTNKNFRIEFEKDSKLVYFPLEIL